jgi:late competence protein required for DNA uptake (superfamily II DNA/RNA helicase)
MTTDSHIDLPTTPPLMQENLTKARVPNARARCAQCGKSMRDMPIFLQNITCRDCYGLERYKRGETSMASTPRSEAVPTAEKPGNS